MAKGKEVHEARQAALQSFGKDLARRARSRCELCERGGESLGIFEVPPVPKEPDFDRCLMLCGDCATQAGEVRAFRPGPHWRFLAEQAWSGNALVQILSIRLLRRQSAREDWAREALETIDPDEDLLAAVTESE